MSQSDVFVIGAGPAGLTAAYLLTKQGIPTTVIEADPTYVGGISRTASYKDFLFDIGGHRFFSKSKEVVDLVEGDPARRLHRAPAALAHLLQRQLLLLSAQGLRGAEQLGYVQSALCVLSYLHKQAFPTANPKSFHDWVANQFGERLFSIFFKTYTEKVWGMSCDEISADWAAQRIKGLDLWSAMSNALRNSLPRSAMPKKGGQQIKTLIESFQYPRKGPGMMWDAAARQVEARGGSIHMGTRLESLRWNPRAKRWTIGAITPDGEWKAFSAGHVISSAPIRELVGKHPSQARLQGCCRALRYRDFLTVALIVDKPDLFPDNWIYIHEPSVKVGRIQNFRSWSPEMVPDDKLACLGLEYFCFEGDGLWTASDAELIAWPRRSSHHRSRCRGRCERTAASCGRRRPIRSTTRATRRTSRRSARSWPRNSPPCTSSAATACTSTTTRTTP
jgi:protoporphyrinogen oxidase